MLPARFRAWAMSKLFCMRISVSKDSPKAFSKRNAMSADSAARSFRRADSAGRVTDIAVDHSEFAHLDGAAVARVVGLMQAAGMTATVSSIHINGWFGDHDKWSGARWIVQRRLGRALAHEADRWVYVGDSTNDQVMFGRFALSVGVANLLHFAAQLHTWPAYLAEGERGQGFAEVARRLLAAR